MIIHDESGNGSGMGVDPAPQTNLVGPQRIETAPAEGFFLAENREGDWIKAQRYDNPFGYQNTVIDNRSGKWWTTERWMPMQSATTEGQSNG